MRMPYKVSDFEFASQLFLISESKETSVSFTKKKVRNNKLNPQLIQSDMTMSQHIGIHTFQSMPVKPDLHKDSHSKGLKK